jgi:hypothetical protein
LRGVFITAGHFHPSLMFAEKARSLSVEWSSERCFRQVGSSPDVIKFYGRNLQWSGMFQISYNFCPCHIFPA